MSKHEIFDVMKIKFYAENRMINFNQYSSAVRGKALRGMLFLGLLLFFSISEMQADNFYQKMLQQLKVEVAETLVTEGNISQQSISQSTIV